MSCPPSLRSRRSTSPTCRRSPACGSRPPRPASATRAAPTCCSRCSIRAPTVAGVFTRSKCPSAPVEWCRAKLKARQGARAGRQFRQRQCLHRQDRPRRPCSSPPKLAAKAVGCKPAEVFLASTGVIGEPLNAEAFDGVMEGMVAPRRAGPLARCRQGDHDHRHVSEGRDRARRSSARRRSRSTASPRAPA